MANGAGIEIPKVSFTTLDPDKIEIESYFIGFDQGNGGKLSKMDHLGNITLIEGAVTSQFKYEIGEWVPSEGGVIAHRWLTNDTVENYLVIDTEDIVLPNCDKIRVNYTVTVPVGDEGDSTISTSDVVSTDGTGMMGKNTYTWQYGNETFVIQWTGSYWAVLCTTNEFDYEQAIAVLNTSSNCPYGTYTIRNLDPSPILSGYVFNSFSITQYEYIDWISADEGLIGSTSRTAGLTNTANLTDAAIEGGFDVPAARLCKERVSNGKSDWYLPAAYEMGKVGQNMLEISQGLVEAGLDLKFEEYFTSTEVDAYAIIHYDFTSGNYAIREKGSNRTTFVPNMARVRAIRKFSI